MKRTLLKLALNILRMAMRLYGWRDSRKPDGYIANEKNWWRPKGDDSIEACNFYEALQFSIREARQ